MGERDVQELQPQIPGYRILAELEADGPARVYKAQQLSLDRIVALKVVPASDSPHARLFMRHARTLAKLNHEHILAGIDIGEAKDYYYFALEYVDGTSMYELVREHGPLPEKRALLLCMQLARALLHMHERGVVHCGVNPRNIMLTATDVAKLCELGSEHLGCDDLAKAAGLTSRTLPSFVAPEQARGDRALDVRTDLYGLGATLYYIVTGHEPYLASTTTGVLTSILTQQPVPAFKLRKGLSAGIRALIDVLMHKDPGMRPATPLALLEQMDHVLARPNKQPVGAGGPKDASIGRARMRGRRRGARGRGRGGRFVAFLVVLILLGGMALVMIEWYKWQANVVEPVRPRASAADEETAFRLVRDTIAYRMAHPEDTDECRRSLTDIVATYPLTTGAAEAQLLLEEWGLVSH